MKLNISKQYLLTKTEEIISIMKYFVKRKRLDKLTFQITARQRSTLAHCTTIDVKVLNFCVRHGNRCDHLAIATELFL